MTCLPLAAAVVAVLAAAGVGAGAEWDVYPGAGTPIQATIDGAGEGDAIHVHDGANAGDADVGKRLTGKIYEEQTIHSYRFMFERA